MRDIYQCYSDITHGKVLCFQLEELLRKSINSETIASVPGFGMAPEGHVS
jgi:hypothetical protein